MVKIIRKLSFLVLGAILLQFGSLNSSYGYVEPAKSILPDVIAPKGLYNPDLPKRQGLKAGEIVFHSAVTTGVMIDPNIYLASQDEKYDIINTLEASFGVEIPLQEHIISLDYQAKQYFFERYNNNNHFDQRVRGLMELNFTDYRVTLNEVFNKYESIPGEDNTGRLKQDDNNVRLGVTHEAGNFAFDLGYSNLVHHYYNDDFMFSTVAYKDRDYMMHVADISVGYKILPKTSIVLENDYGVSTHVSGNSPDYYFDDILVGVKGELHKNLTTTLQAGYRYQYFGASPILYNGKASKFICRGGIKYALSDKDVFDLNVDRTVNDSIYADATFFTMDYMVLNYTHIFTNKLSSRIFGSYQRNMYPIETTEGTKTAKRVDNAFEAGASLHYDIRRWLSAEISYEFKNADSNFKVFSYNDNIALFKITAGF